MKAVGVIVEYNPFHYGHAYHIEKAKKETGADIVIAAMSGNFLQRGEPALVSKWSRTEMAVRGGVDLVFELPYCFAVQKADLFAYGAVSILNAAGCNSICFGSESGQIKKFYDTIDFLETHNAEYNKAIQQFIGDGYSYPKALSLAFETLHPEGHLVDLSKPNNILGFQYVSAAKRINSPVKMLTVKRKNANYHDEHFSSSSIASATSIRKALFSSKGDYSSIHNFVPPHTYKLLLQYQKNYGTPHNWDMYWPYIKLRLIQADTNELKKIYEVEEGIENRLKSLALQCNSFASFMEQLKTKRYTWTRLQRILTHILTNTTKQQMKSATEGINYLRLLGMTENGRAYLNHYKKSCPIPIISKRSSFHHEQLEMDTRAAQVYAMGLPEKYRQKAILLEYNQQPVYMKER